MGCNGGCLFAGETGCGHPDGTILRRFADGNIILKNKWEEVTDEEDLRRYQKCFDDRDRAAAEV
jgi:hypothetical protein